jgi:hypothetical protein
LKDNPSYTLLVENRCLAGWKLLIDEHPFEMQQLIRFLKQHPINLRISNGKAKKLRGQLREYFQYDVNYRDRVRYQVNKKEMHVMIVYTGGHP